MSTKDIFSGTLDLFNHLMELERGGQVIDVLTVERLLSRLNTIPEDKRPGEAWAEAVYTMGNWIKQQKQRNSMSTEETGGSADTDEPPPPFPGDENGKAKPSANTTIAEAETLNEMIAAQSEVVRLRAWLQAISDSHMPGWRRGDMAGLALEGAEPPPEDDEEGAEVEDAEEDLESTD